MLKQLEIQKLENYITSLGLNYQDLRLEIIDHMICLVEEKIMKYPYLSFSSAMQSAAYELDIFRLVNNLNLKVAEKGKEWKNLTWKSYYNLCSGINLFKAFVAFLIVWFLMYIDVLNVTILAIALFSVLMIYVNYFLIVFIRNRKTIKDNLKYYSLFSQYLIHVVWVTYPLIIFDSINDYRNVIHFLSFGNQMFANAYHSLIFIAIILYLLSLYSLLPPQLKLKNIYD